MESCRKSSKKLVGEYRREVLSEGERHATSGFQGELDPWPLIEKERLSRLEAVSFEVTHRSTIHTDTIRMLAISIVQSVFSSTHCFLLTTVSKNVFLQNSEGRRENGGYCSSSQGALQYHRAVCE